MALDVVDMEVSLPNKQSVSTASAYKRRKPCAVISLQMENDEEWQLYTPARVARAYRKDLPSLPKSYDDVLEGLKKLEHKLAMSQVGEMLSRRDYSKGELKEKLFGQGYRQDTSEEVVARAEELKLVDDRRFAQTFIAQKKLAGWGQKRIEQEFWRKKVDPAEVLDDYPDAYFDDDENLETAIRLLRRKSVPQKNPYEKFCAYLVRRGFSYATAKRAASGILRELD